MTVKTAAASDTRIPRTVASRYVAAVGAAFDRDAHERRTVMEFRETLHLLMHQAQKRQALLEDEMARLLQVTASTRVARPVGATAMRDCRAAAAELQQQVEEVERQRRILRDADIEAGDHVATWPQRFVAKMSQLVRLVAAIEWDNPAPGDDPWLAVAPHITHDLVDLGGDTAPKQAGRSRFTAEPIHVTNLQVPVPTNPTPEETSRAQFMRRLFPACRVTCMCPGSRQPVQMDAARESAVSQRWKQNLRVMRPEDTAGTSTALALSEVQHNELMLPAFVYFGTEDGAVFGLPLAAYAGFGKSPLGSDATAAAVATSVQPAVPSAVKKNTGPGKNSGISQAGTTDTQLPVEETERCETLKRLLPAGSRVFSGHHYAVQCVHVFQTADGEKIVSSSIDKTLRISFVATQQLQMVIADLHAAATHCHYHLGLGKLLTSHLDGTVRMWNVVGRSPITPLIQLPSVGSMQALLRAQHGEAITEPQVRPSRLAITAMCVSAQDDRVLVIGTSNGQIFLTRFVPPAPVGSIAVNPAAVVPVMALLPEPFARPILPVIPLVVALQPSFDPAKVGADGTPAAPIIIGGGEAVALGASAGLMTAASTADIEALQQVVTHEDNQTRAALAEGVAAEVILGHKCAVTVVLAPGGGLLFSGDDSGTILWWDTTGAYQAAAMVFRRPQRRLRAHVDAITALDVTPDGLLMSASKDALLVVWSWTEGVPLHTLRAHHNCVTGIFIGALPRRSTKQQPARRPHAERNGQKVTAEANWEATWRGRFSVRALPPTFECVAVSAGMDESINAWSVSCENVSDSDGSDADV